MPDSSAATTAAGKPGQWHPPLLDGALLPAYLRRLGLDPAEERSQPPSPAQLRRLHAAHVARVPYETMWIALDGSRGIHPVESAREVARGRGGYCYHLNGAFAALLASLGYHVTWHRGGVQGRGSAMPPGADGNHLALTTVLDGRTWWLDVGLGDGPLEPAPLEAAAFGRDGGFRLRPSAVVPGGWRFDHEPGGTFDGMDFSLAPAAPADLVDRHVELSTSPASGFVRVVTVQHRTPAGVRALRGRVLTERPVSGPATARDVLRYDEWRAVLTDTFGLALDDVPADRLRAVWRRIQVAHEEWERAGRPRS